MICRKLSIVVLGQPGFSFFVDVNKESELKVLVTLTPRIESVTSGFRNLTFEGNFHDTPAAPV